MHTVVLSLPSRPAMAGSNLPPGLGAAGHAGDAKNCAAPHGGRRARVPAAAHSSGVPKPPYRKLNPIQDRIPFPSATRTNNAGRGRAVSVTRPPYRCPLPQLLPGRGAGHHTMQPFKHPACDCELPRTPPLSINQWDHLLLLLLSLLDFFLKKKQVGSPATSLQQHANGLVPTRSTRNTVAASPRRLVSSRQPCNLYYSYSTVKRKRRITFQMRRVFLPTR